MGRVMSIRNLPRLPRYLIHFANCITRFKNPASLIFHYLRGSSPKSRLITLRSNLQVSLSAHPHDVVTAFVVVAREDYGRIEPNTIVVDIGANIGVYSLYAAYMGARVVYAYEPNAQAYEILLRNIALNGFEHVIFPYRLAVACTSDNMVSIPVEASPYNRTLADDICEHWDSVGTVTLERILIDNGIDYADVLKIDCEGAEYEVLFGTSGAVLSRFRNIRMEYHPGPIDALLGHLQRHRFFLVERNEESATIWVTRSRDSYGVDHRIMEVDRQN